MKGAQGVIIKTEFAPTEDDAFRLKTILMDLRVKAENSYDDGLIVVGDLATRQADELESLLNRMAVFLC